jgi:hypothetical protein
VFASDFVFDIFVLGMMLIEVISDGSGDRIFDGSKLSLRPKWGFLSIGIDSFGRINSVLISSIIISRILDTGLIRLIII